jgi:hypothetical protein
MKMGHGSTHFWPNWPEVGFERNFCSQRAQEIQQRLLVAARQLIELTDRAIGLRPARTMLLDCLHQISRSTIVQEEQPLPYTPKRCGAKFVRTGNALAYAVRQPLAHMVKSKVGKRMVYNVAHSGIEGCAGLQGFGVTQRTAHLLKHTVPLLGIGGRRRGSRRRRQSHRVDERIDVRNTVRRCRMRVFRGGIEHATNFRPSRSPGEPHKTGWGGMNAAGARNLYSIYRARTSTYAITSGCESSHNLRALARSRSRSRSKSKSKSKSSLLA